MTETTPQAPGPEDPRYGCALAVKAARQVADAISVDQLEMSTPCEEYNVGQLLRHLSLAMGKLAEAGRGEDLNWTTMVDDSFADGEHSAALEARGHEIAQAWTDAAKLEQTYEFPWATMAGGAVVGSYAGETLTHAWDLAVATNQQLQWPPDEILQPMLDGLKFGIGDEGRDHPDMPFGPVVEVADDAPIIDQLVAYSGRDPKAWPSAVA